MYYSNTVGSRSINGRDFPVARELNAGCVGILWRHPLKVSSSLALVSGHSLGIHSVSWYFAFTLLCLFVHFYCTCLLGLLACSNYLLIIYWSAETDRVHCIVRVFVLLPL